MKEEWQEVKTRFEKEKLDIILEFDQNKNEQNVPKEQEKQLCFIMQIVQQQITYKFESLGQKFIKDPELWIEFYVRYPLLFNFRERESKRFEKKGFSLDTNEELVEEFLGADTPENKADSFMQALKTETAKVLDTSNENDHLQYLVLVRNYDKESTLTIYRAELKLEAAKVKTVCRGTQKQDLVIDYDKVIFEINNVLAYALYSALMGTEKTELVKRMTEFFLQMAQEEYGEFDRWLKNPTK